MKNKTKVEVSQDTNQCSLLKGYKGYIDGYISSNNKPYAVVVCGGMIDLVPIYALKAI
jgi:hypothetical protein